MVQRKSKRFLRVKEKTVFIVHVRRTAIKKMIMIKNLLVPDENTAFVVQRIFEQAYNGDSTRKIAADLNSDNIIPPLKYRVLYRDNFNDKGRREPQITGITQP